MIQKIKTPLSLFYIKSIFFLLSICILKVNAETKIIAENGDTLYKLSEKHRVPLKELMHKNNFNNANKIIEGEVIIIPFKKNDNDHISYKVIEGDTLYKIAGYYKVNLKDIISLNNLDKPSDLKPDQIIILPKGAINQKNINLRTKKVFYHQTFREEMLSDISKIHKIPIEEIITLNKLNGSSKVNPNTKLKIRRNKTIKWLKYGTIVVNWSDWRYLDGNYITQAKSKKNNSFYLAISCKKRALNNTLEKSYWINWYFPERDFEFELINDFCNKNLET